MAAHRLHRITGFLGAALGLASVALSALASHAWAPTLDAADLQRVHLAVAMAFGHALLLLQIAALMRHAHGLLLGIAGASVVLGIVLFSGSLLGRALAGWPTTLAPAGGVLLMGGWLSLAVWSAAAPRPSKL